MLMFDLLSDARVAVVSPYYCSMADLAMGAELYGRRSNANIAAIGAFAQFIQLR
jgi:hypothetical protein